MTGNQNPTLRRQSASIIHRVTVGLSKEDNRQLQALCEMFGENQGKVLLRALNYFYSEQQ